MKEQSQCGRRPPKKALLTRRSVFFEKYDGFKEIPVYIRERLKCGNLISGPTVVEQYDATTVVYPKWEAEVDRSGSIVLRASDGD
jgi:N-methylhydantoinase A/oxoprolinase/acetone carboxylase beta subunit